ncbi:GNAT family N-acetyltransferase [Hydrogenovibrio kuenenii]|uniref:GNAT family N-acetyltransferase n=1 Tax=Hydrogenovibrio kuenenii TaxID=63658 RepID=UPI000465A49E|nr:GNAT family N-acetyltransferase [Hydrogenovibrio kuenenii]
MSTITSKHPVLNDKYDIELTSNKVSSSHYHDASLLEQLSNLQAEKFVELIHNANTSQQPVINNIETLYRTVSIGNTTLPMSINSAEYENSYVCSPYTAYISYAKDELGLLKRPLLEKLLSASMTLAGRFLKLGQINRTISVNNWLVSTNLLPKFNPYELQKTTQKLIREYPSHSLSIRSLNAEHNAELMQTLSDQGWLLIPARQVYLFDTNQTWWKRNHTKKDQSLLRKVEAGKTTLKWLKPEALETHHFAEIQQCFNQLFIEKHSRYNPQFTESFLKALHDNALVEFHSFTDETGRIVASIGLFTQQNTITTPIVGYDTSLPQELGLYRLLMAVLLRLTYERKQPMNLSSGAGSFKRARGGEPTLEYTAFYCHHLPWHRRIIHKNFSSLVNRYAPQMFEQHQI